MSIDPIRNKAADDAADRMLAMRLDPWEIRTMINFISGFDPLAVEAACDLIERDRLAVEAEISS